MAIRMTCTGCDSALNLADSLRGKKVRCKKCGTSLKVPDENVDDVDDDDAAVQEEPKLKIKSKKANKAANEEDTGDGEDDQPAKKKKKKKKSKKGSSGMLIAAGVAGLVLLLAGGGVSAFFLFRKGPTENRQAKTEPTKNDADKSTAQIFPKVEDGSPTKKGGTGIVNNIRGAVYRTTIRNDLAGINKMHAAFMIETPKSQHTREKFLDYIKRDFRTAHDYIIEGYYRVNVKAQPGSSDIVAGERDIDLSGHLVVRGNGMIEYVSAAEWKKAM